jgi:UDP-N-acetyl-2-amino-2-deoxyglucuronate dehydrogenase
VTGTGDRVGVGIVGTGLSATQHLTALKDVPNGRVVAVELNPPPGVGVVHTCTPPDARLRLVELAASNGKHVLVEKPMARTVAEADQLIETCERAGVQLAAMFQNRFTPLARSLKAGIDEGRLGRLLLVTVNAKWYRAAEYYTGSGWRGTAEREGGAVLINQAIHSIDLMRWLAGPLVEVEALTATQLHPIDMEDVGLALLRFANGAVGSIVATTIAYPGFPDRLELHGSDGSAILAQGEGRLEWYLRGQAASRPEGQARVEQAADQVSRGSQDPAATPSGGHIAEFTDFYAAIREGRPPFVDGREGRHALEVVEAIYRSGREQKPVKLPL